MWGSATNNKQGNKKQRVTKRNFFNSYLTEFMWPSKLNRRDPLKEILKDSPAFWPPMGISILCNFIFYDYFILFI